MNIIKAGYEIQTPISEGGLEELKLIEKCARTCYKSEDKITEDGESAKALISRLIKSGHLAMLEHSFLSVKFYVDRGISHEIVRHRLFSFAQSSTRYCNYSKDRFSRNITFIDIGPYFDSDEQDQEWLEAMKEAENHYMSLISKGVSPQIARSVLPNSTMTELNVSGNYREWRHFFELRCSSAAHPQMREVTIPLLRDLQSRIPIIFDDIEVE